jgi:hypothetical protein
VNLRENEKIRVGAIQTATGVISLTCLKEIGGYADKTVILQDLVFFSM